MPAPEEKKDKSENANDAKQDEAPGKGSAILKVPEKKKNNGKKTPAAITPRGEVVLDYDKLPLRDLIRNTWC